MIIGIDLGTTNSLVAYYGDDGPHIIPNRLGGRLTPSVVSVEGEHIYVGDVAKERMLTHPEDSAAVFKRTMGTDAKYRLSGRLFRSEELSSFILRSLKEDAEAFLGEEITEAVISVPAYFNDARSTAAAVAHGLYDMQDDAKVLVFDLGGGTFDVSILELSGTILEVRAVAGDNYLGGEDFTAVIEDMWYKKAEVDRDSLDEKTLRHVHKQAENCKLIIDKERMVDMKCMIGDEEKEVRIRLDEFEKNCEELLERII